MYKIGPLLHHESATKFLEISLKEYIFNLKFQEISEAYRNARITYN